MAAKYSITFLILAIAFGLVGIVSWDSIGYPAVFFLYGAVSFVVIAVAYAGLGPRVFGKRVDGRLTPISWLLLGPYLLLNALAFWLYRCCSRKPAYVEVVPNLFFGRRLIGQEAKSVSWLGVLDLAVEFSEVGRLRKTSRYRSLPILDATAPTVEQLRDAVCWLTQAMSAGPVYVHCALGHGRSATIVIAYLLSAGLVGSTKEGLTRLRSLRPGKGLHPGQAQLLRKWSAEVGVKP